MKAMIKFLKESHHWQHLVGGFAVGLFGLSVYGALYSALVAACALELKDHQWGGVWDWVDLSLTFGGGILAALLWAICPIV